MGMWDELVEIAVNFIMALLAPLIVIVLAVGFVKLVLPVIVWFMDLIS